jgi:hypothetical protein
MKSNFHLLRRTINCLFLISLTFLLPLQKFLFIGFASQEFIENGEFGDEIDEEEGSCDSACPGEKFGARLECVYSVFEFDDGAGVGHSLDEAVHVWFCDCILFRHCVVVFFFFTSLIGEGFMVGCLSGCRCMFQARSLRSSDQFIVPDDDHQDASPTSICAGYAWGSGWIIGQRAIGTIGTTASHRHRRQHVQLD